MDYALIKNWMKRYEDAWRGQLDITVADVFADDVTYQPEPFKDAIVGLEAIKEFWEEHTEADEEFTLTWELVASEGDIAVLRVAVDYTAPREEHWRNLWVIRLDNEGLCFAFEEWPFHR